MRSAGRSGASRGGTFHSAVRGVRCGAQRGLLASNGPGPRDLRHGAREASRQPSAPCNPLRRNAHARRRAQWAGRHRVCRGDAAGRCAAMALACDSAAPRPPSPLRPGQPTPPHAHATAAGRRCSLLAWTPPAAHGRAIGSPRSYCALSTEPSGGGGRSSGMPVHDQDTVEQLAAPAARAGAALYVVPALVYLQYEYLYLVNHASRLQAGVCTTVENLQTLYIYI